MVEFLQKKTDRWRAKSLSPSPSNKSAVVMLALFCAVLAMTGGASRADEPVLIVLRPLGMLALGWSVWSLPLEDWKKASIVLLPLLGFALICLLQLVPLPPDVWASLPGRNAIVDIDSIVFKELPWRATTFSPRGTWNTLFNLMVLLAAIGLYLRAGPERLTLALRIFLTIFVISALLGLLQAQGIGSIRTYQTVSPNPSGLFTNSNHFGLACSLAILWAGWLASQRLLVRSMPGGWMLASLLSLILLAGAFSSQSRMAIASLGLALPMVGFLFLRSFGWLGGGITGRARLARRRNAPRMTVQVTVILLVVFAVVGFLVWYVSAISSLNVTRSQGVALADDMRFAILPRLLSMTAKHWVTGIGFGAFAPFYAIAEPDSLMLNKYINQAHDDVLQLLLEGGILSVLFVILAGAVFWKKLVHAVRAGQYANATLFGGTALVVAIGSFVDYPLRTPLFAIPALLVFVAVDCSENLGRNASNDVQEAVARSRRRS